MSTPLPPMPPTFEDALVLIQEADEATRNLRARGDTKAATAEANAAEAFLGYARRLAGDDPVKLARLAVVENRRQRDAYGVTLRPNEDALLTHIERLLTIIDGPATPDHFEVHPGDDPAEIEAFEAGAFEAGGES